MCPDPAHLLTRRPRKAFSVALQTHFPVCSETAARPSPELPTPGPVRPGRTRDGALAWAPRGLWGREGGPGRGHMEAWSCRQRVSQQVGQPCCPEPQVPGRFQVFSQVWLSQDNRTSKDGCGSSAPKQTKAGPGGHLGHPVDRVQGRTGLPDRDRPLAGLGARHARLPERGLGLEAWVQLFGLSTWHTLIPGLCMGTVPIPNRSRGCPRKDHEGRELQSALGPAPVILGGGEVGG